MIPFLGHTSFTSRDGFQQSILSGTYRPLLEINKAYSHRELASTYAESVFVQHWMFLYGALAYLLTYNACKFPNRFFAAFCVLHTKQFNIWRRLPIIPKPMVRWNGFTRYSLLGSAISGLKLRPTEISSLSDWRTLTVHRSIVRHFLGST